MFTFGQQGGPVKATAANKSKSRRVSLADRSSSHRNDENAAPAPAPTPRMQKGPNGKQQPFFQAKMPPATGTCPVPASPPRQAAPGGGSLRGGGGGGAAATTQVFNQNFELKRRLQEMESMVQSSEQSTCQLQAQSTHLQEQNNQLRQQVSQARADLEAANARADGSASGAQAEAERLRREVGAKSEEVAGLRRDAEAAREEIATLRREAATTREGAARALEDARVETEAAKARGRAAEELALAMKEAAAKAEDATRKASKSLKAEAARALKAEAAKTSRAEAAAAAADRSAATAKASAAAEVAAARRAAAASAAGAEAAIAAAAQQAEEDKPQLQTSAEAVLAGRLEALAARGRSTGSDASSQPKLGKKRGRGDAASTAAGGGRRQGKGPAGHATPGETGPYGEGELPGGGRRVELPELTKGFCEFLAAYTAQGLPLGDLIRLVEAAPSLGDQEGDGGDDDREGDVAPPPPSGAADAAKKEPRDGAAKREDSFAVVSAGAAASAAAMASPVAAPEMAPAVVVTPPESVMPVPRPTTSRREMLNARRKEKQRQTEEKERIQQQRERERAERQREARQQRKDAARRKAVEARLRQETAEAALLQKAEEDAGHSTAEADVSSAAATAEGSKAKAEAMVGSPAVPRHPRPDEDREHEQPQRKQKQQPRRKQAMGEEGEKKMQRAQNARSKRAKQTPPQHQQYQQHQHQHQHQHAQSPAIEQPGGSNIEARGGEETVGDPSALSAAPGPRPRPLDAAQADDEAAPAVPADQDEAGGVVEEVPMPNGDIEDVFFCAGVGGVGGVGGDSAASGLIVGGGGDGYGTVGDWLHDGDGSSLGIGSGGTPDAPAGGERKKGKGRARKAGRSVEVPATEAGSFQAGIEAGEGGSEGDGEEGKKRRRRSMRMIKTPIKFGTEEDPQANEAGGARSAGPRQDRSKRGSPEPAATPATPPTSLTGGGAERVEQQTAAVAPASISCTPVSAGGGTSGATGSAAAPAVAADCEVSAVPATMAVVAGTGADAAAARCSEDQAIPEAGVAKEEARPAKRKPAVVSNQKKRIRANRFRAGVTPSAAAATAAATVAATAAAAAAASAAAPPLTKAARDLPAATASTTTPPVDSIFATATVAKMAVDNMFDIAAIQLSAGQSPAPSTAAARTAAGDRARKARGSCREAAAGPTDRARVSQSKSRGGGCDEAPATAGGERASRISKARAELKTSEAAAGAAAKVVKERVLPFEPEFASGLTARDILEAASSRSWTDGPGAAEEGPRGVLTGVLATAQALTEKHMKGAGAQSPPFLSALPSEMARNFDSLLASIVATEACSMRHELRAATEAGETIPTSAVAAAVAAKGGGATATSATGSKKKKKKSVRFCAFDFSTVDMPTDALENSDLAAKEVAECLAHVVTSSKLLEKDLTERTGSEGSGRARLEAGVPAAADGGVGAGAGRSKAVMEAFKRGLKTVAVIAEPSSSLLIASVQGACQELGNEVSAEVVKRAAFFLLESLESLDVGTEVAVRCPLKRRLAGVLSALIRYNLRILLNPPPLKSLSSLHIADLAGIEDRPRKVYEVIQLVSEESKPKRKDVFDPTRDGTTSAVVSRALRRLYGFSNERAGEVLSSAEAFVAEVGSRTDLSTEEKALRVQRHSQDTVDIVAAIRARSFILELLEFPGVELAVSQTRGWGELERLSKQLKQVEDTPDADASLTLLGDVRGLKEWLGRESLWRHDVRAKSILTKLDELLVGCDRREARRFSQEARRRIWFPRVKSPEPIEEGGLSGL